jgi:hypothetical protein
MQYNDTCPDCLQRTLLYNTLYNTIHDYTILYIITQYHISYTSRLVQFALPLPAPRALLIKIILIDEKIIVRSVRPSVGVTLTAR